MTKIYKFVKSNLDVGSLWQEKFEKEEYLLDQPEGFSKYFFHDDLLHYLKKDGHYIQGGCALGSWVYYLDKKGFDVQGFEEAETPIRLIKTYAPDLNVRTGQTIKVPAEDNSFNGYLLFGALGLAENNPDTIIREAKRILKSDGHLFLEVNYLNFTRRFFYAPLKKLEFLFKKNVLGQKPVFAYSLYSLTHLKRLLASQSFKINFTLQYQSPEPKQDYGLYIDWPFLRGGSPYRLNSAGKALKNILAIFSKWSTATSVFVVASKK